MTTDPQSADGAPGGPNVQEPLEPAALPDLLHLKAEPPAPWKRVLLALGGVVCLVLGVVGWLVPIITGIPFYVLGLVLFGMASPAVGQRINAWERRLPRRQRLWLRPGIRRAEKRLD